jgi:outer membrane protein OmpA-like peptidoglycan-associated protein
MTSSFGKFASFFTSGVVAGTLSLMAGAPAFAQSLEQQINDALQPKTAPALTRGLTLTRSLAAPTTAEPTTPAQQQFINRLRTRSIAVEPTGPGVAPGPAAPPPPVVAVEDRNKIAEIVKELPKIDLEINFDYNSWVVGPKAVPALVALGNVLSKANFQGTVFFINGHTDGAGSPEYNQVLSQRRADAVRKMLIDQYHLAPDTLIAVGFGKEQLKNPANPLADENRRVEIANTQMKAAGR